MRIRIDGAIAPVGSAYVREFKYGKPFERPLKPYTLKISIAELIAAAADYYTEYAEDDMLQQEDDEYVAEIDLKLRAIGWPPLVQLANDHPALAAEFIKESDYHLLLKLLSTEGSAETRSFWINSVDEVTVDADQVVLRGSGIPAR